MSMAATRRINPEQKTLRRTQGETEDNQKKPLKFWGKVRGVSLKDLMCLDEMPTLHQSID